VAAGFTVIGLAPTLLRGDNPRLWAVAISLTMATAGLIFPAVLRPVFKVWMAIGAVLGWVNTRIILGLTFYGMIVPIGFILRLAKKDPMNRNFDSGAATYKVPRTSRPASHMYHQY
jgi:hypothetical protein